MNIIAYFANNGTPAEGLSPVIDGYRVGDGVQVIAAQAMAEIGGGFYKYDFAGYDTAEDYGFVCDGGASLMGAERYAVASADIQGEITDISDQIDLITGAVGANAVTITVVDGVVNPIADCEVRINNSAESALVTYGVTDINGVFSCSLDDGAYKVRLRKVGCTFTAPETLTVSGATVVTYTGTQDTIGTPVDSDACRIYEYCYAADGATPLASVNATAKISVVPYDADGKLHSKDALSGTYDPATGLLYWDIVKGAQVLVLITELGVRSRITIPAATTARISDL
ncbi:MAG: hypothetical protein P1P89_13775 [Desulfobacterales bacterium]|nr:hypothetical protein [Desulfobacterales bacterium]